MVINKLCCESQVAGGVIMGVNYALFEKCILDRVTGRQVNPDMEFYKLGGISDMPKVIVHMHDMPERERFHLDVYGEILDDQKPKAHELPAWAMVENGELIYPAEKRA